MYNINILRYFLIKVITYVINLNFIAIKFTLINFWFMTALNPTDAIFRITKMIADYEKKYSNFFRVKL